MKVFVRAALAALFVCITFWTGSARADFAATATDASGIPVLPPYCANVDYGTSPWNTNPTVTHTTYCVLVAENRHDYGYGWSLSSSNYGGWPGISFPCGYLSCKTGYVDWQIGWIHVDCPSNASVVAGDMCHCNTGYVDNPQTHKSCSVLVEQYRTQKKPPCLTCANGGRMPDPPAPPPPTSNPTVGNPIYPLTGVKSEQLDTGMGLRGFPLILTYDSAVGLRPATTGDATILRPPDAFGKQWYSSFDRRLQIAVGSKRALLSRGDGQVLTFIGDGAGNYTPDGTVVGQLITTSAGFRFNDLEAGAIETFDGSGKLTGVQRIDGATLSFMYTGDNLVLVQSDEGRFVQFRYSPDNRIKTITNYDGSTISVGYDGSGNLTTWNWPDGRIRTFQYEIAALPWALTGITDENGGRYATFGYDTAGHAISTEHAGGTNRFVVDYVAAPTWVITDTFDAPSNTVYRVHEWGIPTGTTVSQPNGQSISLSAQAVFGMPAVSSQSQPSGSGSAPGSFAVSYDAAGNVASRDDAGGVRTCYVYDGLHRETSRVYGISTNVDCAGVTSTGAAPPGAARMTTSWHPDWKLPVVIAEPRKRTTFVYQGQPDPMNGNVVASCGPTTTMPDGKPLPLLCKRVVQALSSTGGVDASVAAQSTSFTYDGAGHVTSSTDANAKTSTLAYFSTTDFNSGSAKDANYVQVQLLLHGNGTNGSTTIVDDSSVHRAVTSINNAAISTAQSMFGGSSMAFTGGSDYLSIPYTSDFAFGSGDFTIEAFVYKNANSPNGSRIWNPDGDYYDGVNLGIDTSGNFGFYASTTGSSWTHSLPVIANLANGQWYHLAVVRSGGSIFAFVNGAKYVVTTTLGDAALYSDTTHARVIGGQSGINRALNGYVDEFRITKGVARYSDSFTIPAAAFPDSGPSKDSIGHTNGDLQAVTNAAGQTTRYTQYDPAGRARQVVDAKGITTDISYTQRGLVGTVTVTPPGGASRTTSYAYDGVGQVTQVTNPDGTTLAYSYDAAHRLTGITDARGNNITYTLDASGNRVGEQVSDPAGLLRRTVSRSFDALNRLQQVTGANQ